MNHSPGSESSPEQTSGRGQLSKRFTPGEVATALGLVVILAVVCNVTLEPMRRISARAEVEILTQELTDRVNLAERQGLKLRDTDWMPDDSPGSKSRQLQFEQLHWSPGDVRCSYKFTYVGRWRNLVVEGICDEDLDGNRYVCSTHSSGGHQSMPLDCSPDSAR